MFMLEEKDLRALCQLVIELMKKEFPHSQEEEAELIDYVIKNTPLNCRRN